MWDSLKHNIVDVVSQQTGMGIGFLSVLLAVVLVMIAIIVYLIYKGKIVTWIFTSAALSMLTTVSEVNLQVLGTDSLHVAPPCICML